MSAPDLASQAAIQILDLAKSFGTGPDRVEANAGVNLSVRRGTIHAVVGENGAGKSTAMKCLFGMIEPDSGKIRLAPDLVGSVGMVHQHFMLAGPCTVLENIVLGCEGVGPFAAIDFEAARAIIRARASRYSMPVDPDAKIEDLPVGVQQRVEILKLLYRDSKVLILDEPTAVLTPSEIEAFFENLRRLRDEGRTLLIITHKLKEVLALSDQVTVLRQGRTVGTLDTAEATAEGLAEMMVGRKVELHSARAHRSEAGRSAPVRLSLSDVGGLSFDLRAGEVVGIAGVEGNGQSELLQALLGPSGSGKLQMLGHDVSDWSSARIRKLNVAFFPEDRHRDGLVLDQSVERNLLLGHQQNPHFVGRGGVIREEALSDALSRAWNDYDLRPNRAGISARSLSGGNQQKLVIAREFEPRAGGKPPELVIAAHPTRGVDVGAIEWIHQKILRSRDAGAGVLLVSSELDEILALSDRILVMFAGRIVAEFKAGEGVAAAVGRAMGGLSG